MVTKDKVAENTAAEEAESSARMSQEAQDTARESTNGSNGQGRPEDWVTWIETGKDGQMVVKFANGSRVYFQNDLPVAMDADGGRYTYVWRNGILAEQVYPDGSRVKFENNVWQHYKADGSKNEGVKYDSMQLQTGVNKAVEIKGPVTEARIRSLKVVSGIIAAAAAEQQDGTQVAPQGQEVPQAEPEEEVVSISTTASSDQTLLQAAETLKNNLDNQSVVEATLFSIPERKAFEEQYQKLTGVSLRDELARRGYQDALATLDSASDRYDLPALQHALTKTSEATDNSSSKNLLEHSIRSTFSRMTKDDIDQLEKGCAEQGKTLAQVIEESNLSPETKQALAIYSKGAENLTTEDHMKLAQIAIDALNNVDRSDVGKLYGQEDRSLLLLQEAFAGDAAHVVAARQQFMAQHGEALKQAFREDPSKLQKAMDYAEMGRLHPATLINEYSNGWVSKEEAVETIIRGMNPADRARYVAGQRMGAEPAAGTAEHGDYQFYKRVNTALDNAFNNTLHPLDSISWNRRAKVLQMEDYIQNGERTLLGRIAKENGIGDNNAAVAAAFWSMNRKDWDLVRKDPAYRDQIYEAIGGKEAYGKVGNKSFTPFMDYDTWLLAKRKLDDIFINSSTFEEAKEKARPKLVELAVGVGFNHASDATVYDGIKRSNPQEYAQLDGMTRNKLLERVNGLPEGVRDSARAMIDDLSQGRKPQETLRNQIDSATLKGLKPDEVTGILLRAQEKDPKLLESIRNDPQMLEAVKRAYGSNYESHGKEFVETGHISINKLRSNQSWFESTSESVGLAADSNHNFKFYRNLAAVPEPQRQQLVEAAQKARAGDAEAQQFLDRELSELSEHQRRLTLAVLSNPDKRPTTADKVFAQAIGDNSDFDALIKEFSGKTSAQKGELIREYTNKYGSYLVTDWIRACHGDEAKVNRVKAAVATSDTDLQKVFDEEVQRSGRGTFENTKLVEQHIQETNKEVQAKLAAMSPQDRARAETELQKLRQDFLDAVNRHDKDKDAYASRLVQKFFEVAGVVAAPAVTSLPRFAAAVAISALMKPAIEQAVTGREMTGSQFAGAAFMGSLEGVFNFADPTHSGAVKGAIRNAFESVGRDALQQLGKEARDQIEREVGELVTRNLSSNQPISVESIERIVAGQVSNPAEAKQIAKQIHGTVEKNLIAEADKIRPRPGQASDTPAPDTTGGLPRRHDPKDAPVQVLNLTDGSRSEIFADRVFVTKTNADNSVREITSYNDGRIQSVHRPASADQPVIIEYGGSGWPQDGPVKQEVLPDKTTIETFAGGEKIYYRPDNVRVRLDAQGQVKEVTLPDGDVWHNLKGTWNNHHGESTQKLKGLKDVLVDGNGELRVVLADGNERRFAPGKGAELTQFAKASQLTGDSVPNITRGSQVEYNNAKYVVESFDPQTGKPVLRAIEGENPNPPTLSAYRPDNPPAGMTEVKSKINGHKYSQDANGNLYRFDEASGTYKLDRQRVIAKEDPKFLSNDPLPESATAGSADSWTPPKEKFVDSGPGRPKRQFQPIEGQPGLFRAQDGTLCQVSREGKFYRYPNKDREFIPSSGGPGMYMPQQYDPSKRVIRVGDNTVEMNLKGGFYYPDSLPKGGGLSNGPLKVHLNVEDAQSLHRVQAVVLDALAKDKELQALVSDLKTIDPEAAFNGASYIGSGQNAKAFTIYASNPESATKLATKLDELMQRAGLSTDKRPGSIEAEATFGQSGRVTISRDKLERSLSSTAAQPLALVDTPLAKAIENDPRFSPRQTRQLTDEQLRIVESEVGLRNGLLRYDASGQLCMDATVGVSFKDDAQKFAEINRGHDGYHGGIYISDVHSDPRFGFYDGRRAYFKLAEAYGTDPAKLTPKLSPAEATQAVNIGGRFIEPNRSYMIGSNPRAYTSDQAITVPGDGIAGSHMAVQVDNEGYISIQPQWKNNYEAHKVYVNGLEVPPGRWYSVNANDRVTLVKPDGPQVHLFRGSPPELPQAQVDIGGQAIQPGRIYTIGRYETDIQIADNFVSGPNADRAGHAAFWVDGNGTMFIQDLGSTNGTWINGKEIPKKKWVQVKPEDVVTMAQNGHRLNINARRRT